MESAKIPFNLYDHIAIIFPGALILPLLYFFFPEANKYFIALNDLSEIIFVIFIIILAFSAGHALYMISKYITDWVACKILRVNTDRFKDLDNLEQKSIISAVEKIYNTDFGLMKKLDDYRKGKLKGREFGVRNRCFAAVKDEINGYYTFVSLADFLRSTSFVLFIYLVIFMFGLYTSLFNFGFGRNSIIFICLFLAILVLFKRSVDMRKKADTIIYNEIIHRAEAIDNKR